MDQKQIEIKVIEIISGVLDVDKSNIATKTPLKNLGIDSLDRIDILIKIEKEFKINYVSINPDFIYNISIERLCKCIEIAIISKGSPGILIFF